MQYAEAGEQANSSLAVANSTLISPICVFLSVNDWSWGELGAGADRSEFLAIYAAYGMQAYHASLGGGKHQLSSTEARALGNVALELWLKAVAQEQDPRKHVSHQVPS